MNLSDIFCQDNAINSLQCAFAAEKIPHAYIFSGADGVGKFSTARCWAKVLLCVEPVKRDGLFQSCNECVSCQAFDAESHPDYNHVYKELIQFTKNPQNRKKSPIDLPIDVVREFVIYKAPAKPTLSRSKVFIVSEAEKLNVYSQNALLKVLEEPAGNSFIILLCTKLDNLLPTTRSRCQIIRFGPVDEERIVEYLCGKGADKKQAKFWARFTDGSMGQSELFSQLEPSFYDIKKQIIQKFSQYRIDDTVDLSQWLGSTISELADSWQKIKADTSKSDIARQMKRAFVQVFISALNDAMKSEFVGADEMVHFDQKENIGKLAGKYSPVECARMIEKCFKSNRFIDASVNDKLIFEHLLLNFADSGILIDS